MHTRGLRATGRRMRTFVKDPTDKLDYSRDWSPKLGAGETIVSSTWTIEEPHDEALLIADESFDATSTTVWLEAGTAGQRYRLANTIVSNLQRTWERSLEILVKDM